jgi:hypothetical protein
VHQWQQWAEQMGLAPALNAGDEEQAAQREADVYARLIALGLQRQDTELTFVPTLNGERADPNSTGSVLNLRMDNWGMGDISAALSRGLVENLFAMIPPELQPLVPVQPYVPALGTGPIGWPWRTVLTCVVCILQDDRHGQRAGAQRAATAVPAAAPDAALAAAAPDGRRRRRGRGAHPVAARRAPRRAERVVRRRAFLQSLQSKLKCLPSRNLRAT